MKPAVVTLEFYNQLLKEYKRLQSEHNVLLQVHMKTIDDCINDKIKLQKRIKKLRRINNERIL